MKWNNANIPPKKYGRYLVVYEDIRCCCDKYKVDFAIYYAKEKYWQAIYNDYNASRNIIYWAKEPSLPKELRLSDDI